MKVIKHGIEYNYDNVTKLYTNINTGKSTQRPRPSAKGKAVGKAVGKAKGKAIGQSIKHIKEGNTDFTYYNFDILFINSMDEVMKERMYMFLTKISQKYTNYKYRIGKKYDLTDDIEFDGKLYAQFSSDEITALLTNKFKTYVNYLIKGGYIKEVLIDNPNTKYIVKEENLKYKSFLYTYEPTDKLLQLTATKSYVSTLRVWNSMHTYYKIGTKKLGEYYSYFLQMYTFKITITKSQYIEHKTEMYHKQYIQKKKFKKYFKCVDNGVDVVEKNKGLKKKIKIPQILSNYISNGINDEFDKAMFYNTLSKFDKLDYYSKDKFSGRFHTRLSNLPSFMTDYINVNKYNNKNELNCSIDMMNCQPVLLAKDAYDHIGENKFTTDVYNNDLYLMMMDEYDLDSREISKEFFFNLVFGKTHYGKNENSYHTQFKKLYPKVANYIAKLKNTKNNLDNQHSILAQRLQKMEVKCWSEVWSILHSKGILFQPKHDEVIVEECNKEITLEVITDVMDKYIGKDNYKLKINK